MRGSAFTRRARHVVCESTPSSQTAVAGHDAEDASSAFNQTRAFPIYFSNSQFKPTKRHHPYCLARPRVGPSPFLLLSPQNMRGMARQVAQPLFFQCPCSLSKTRGASRRAITASSLLRRAALFVDRLSCSPGFPRLAAVSGAWLTKPRDSRRPSVSQLLAGGSYWPPGGAPAPPGCVLCEARPRAPHPAPPSDASR